MKGYKITTKDMTTFNDFQWQIGSMAVTDGNGDLCGSGWLHFYQHPLLAVLLNPIHGAYADGRLFEVEAGGRFKYDRGLKVGATEMTLVREIEMPKPTLPQLVAFANGCAEFANRAAVEPRRNPDEILAELAKIAEKACA